MTTLYRQRTQHERQRNELSYQGSWGFPGKHTKYKRPEDTVAERRWYAVLLVCLTLINIAIFARVVFILWK